ncbi:uncharacterized protein RHO17_004357 isoform 1-T1 [Thomomys bottae]
MHGEVKSYYSGNKLPNHLAQQNTEEKTQPVNAFGELSSIVSKLEIEDGGACESPGPNVFKVQKEELAPKISVGSNMGTGRDTQGQPVVPQEPREMRELSLSLLIDLTSIRIT